MNDRPDYLRVMLTIARNSLVRSMMFRANFVIESISSLAWMLMSLGFYMLIFNYTNSIGAGTGWGRYEFFVFLSTTLFINSLVQAFFMPNFEEFSELIRTGRLDFALLKPIDTQFLVSLHRVDWSALSNGVLGAVLLGYSLWQMDYRPGLVEVLLYPLSILCGVVILYSLMISLAATSIWLGRNQNLYNFWFYITNFSRYPMEIYAGPMGTPMRHLFTFIVPVLIVVNVPARLLAKPLHAAEWYLTGFALVATLASLVAARWIFTRALFDYRSASS